MESDFLKPGTSCGTSGASNSIRVAQAHLPLPEIPIPNHGIRPRFLQCLMSRAEMARMSSSRKRVNSWKATDTQ